MKETNSPRLQKKIATTTQSVSHLLLETLFLVMLFLKAAKERCDAGYGVNKTGEAVYLDLLSTLAAGKEQAHVKGLDENDAALVKKLGQEVVRAKYGNLFQMYEKIVKPKNPHETPMMIYPAVHYAHGRVW